MTRIRLTDPVLIEQLRRAGTGVLRDPEGRLLCSFAVVTPDEPPTDGARAAKNPERPDNHPEADA